MKPEIETHIMELEIYTRKDNITGRNLNALKFKTHPNKQKFAAFVVPKSQNKIKAEPQLKTTVQILTI
jgi:hypothetical protein